MVFFPVIVSGQDFIDFFRRSHNVGHGNVMIHKINDGCQELAHIGLGIIAPVVSSFLTAEAQRCQCVFLPKGLAKAGVAAIATGVGDIVHAEIGIDKQFGGTYHATVFEIGADGGVIAKSEASFQFLFIEVDLAA